MGKIFGISDLPVSTIMTPFEPVVDFRDPREIDFKQAKSTLNANYTKSKIFLFQRRSLRNQIHLLK